MTEIKVGDTVLITVDTIPGTYLSVGEFYPNDRGKVLRFSDDFVVIQNEKGKKFSFPHDALLLLKKNKKDRSGYASIWECEW